MSSSSVRISFSFLLWALLISPAVSQTCKSQTFSGYKTYPHCLDLPELKAFLHYSYDAANTTLAVVFSAPSSKPGGRIAWAINPKSTGMVGAQTFVAYKDPDNGVAIVKTLNISSYSSLIPSKLAFDVWDMKAEEAARGGGTLRIFARIKVPANLVARGKVNQVWQVGPEVGPGGMIGKHAFDPPNLVSKGHLDLNGNNNGGLISSGGEEDSKIKNRNIHGILNALSWGILFPIGEIIARYMKLFESADPAWFYLHVSCQFSGYVPVLPVGAPDSSSVASPRVFNSPATITLALPSLPSPAFRCLHCSCGPKKDHKYGVYWNVYHHGLGFVILSLEINNVFKGLNILNPQDTYMIAYIAVIAHLGGIALLLEVITWVIVCKRKSNNSLSILGPEQTKILFTLKDLSASVVTDLF